MRPVTLALLLAVLVAACSTGTVTDPDAEFVPGDGTSLYAPADREPAPPVVGRTLEGRRLALADLDGPVVVNFWASWCGPCAEEAPHLAAIAREYRDRGVHVVGVNVKDQPANARSFERDFAVPYPSWYDEAATIAASFGGVGPGALPTTIVLDRRHRVAARMFGAVSAAELGIHLEQLLDGRP